MQVLLEPGLLGHLGGSLASAEAAWSSPQHPPPARGVRQGASSSTGIHRWLRAAPDPPSTSHLSPRGQQDLQRGRRNTLEHRVPRAGMVGPTVRADSVGEQPAPSKRAHPQKGPSPGLTLSCHLLEILHRCWTKAPRAIQPVIFQPPWASVRQDAARVVCASYKAPPLHGSNVKGTLWDGDIVG